MVISFVFYTAFPSTSTNSTGLLKRQAATSQVVSVLLTSRKSEAKKQKKKIKVNHTSIAREIIGGEVHDKKCEFESLQKVKSSQSSTKWIQMVLTYPKIEYL